MAFLSIDDQKLDVPQQRTDAWFKQRKNRITGSRLSEFNFIDSEEALREYYGIIWEGAPKPPFTEEQRGWMAWGVEHEPIATADFIKHFPEYVILECPFYPHPCGWIGASPDGTYYKVKDGKVVEEGCIEIKTPAKHKRPYPYVKDYYISQMYFEMACTGMRRTIFISWGPKCMRAWLLIWRDDYWQALCNLLYAFRRKDLPFPEFLELQHEMLRIQKEIVEESKPLHSGKGIDVRGST